jgi:hypothetical protein
MTEERRGVFPPMTVLIDHVTVCGSNLEKMRQDFAGAGLNTTYGGHHANGVTHMDLLTFPDGSYIELIAPVSSLGGATGMMSGWAKLMEGNAGAGAWAARTGDIDKEVDRLRTAGIEVRGPEPGSRQRPDSTKLEWKTAIVGSGPAGSVLPFLIEDKTLRGLRVPAPAETSEIEGVAAVIIAVHDLQSSVDQFHRAYDFEKPTVEDHAEFGTTIAHFAGTPVMLAAPNNESAWLGDRTARFGECPTAFLLKPADFPRAVSKFELKDRASWFGRDIAWFDPQRLGGTRVGLIR